MINYFYLFNNFHFLIFIILLISLCGLVLNFKNIIIFFIYIELSLLAVNLIFIISSICLNDLVGIVFVLVILTIAAAEVSIGLAILVLYYRTRYNILISNKYFLKG